MFKIFVQQYDRKNSKCLGLFSNGVGVGRREGCMIEWCIFAPCLSSSYNLGTYALNHDVGD